MGHTVCGDFSTYADDIHRLAATEPALAAALAGFTSIAQVVDWFSLSGDGKPAIDIIAMDEFEYDFLVQTPAGFWLAFGVT